ncbi:MAG: ribulose 1,5-bisphosphate carboxylase large subunit [Spirochaetes bacterium]|nr:ribulose 1,5-bisphosphate carboxylase large subunit [Spirochaetota bacterium]
MTDERFDVVYRIKADKKKSYAIAKTICYEQTVELDEELITDRFIKDNIVGKITDFNRINEDVYQASISYPSENSSYELTQFLNVMFGNTSIKKNIKVMDFKLSPALVSKFKGPKFGASGIRSLIGIKDKPLLAAALKPMGKSVKELAEIAYSFALGGIDIVKDDHGLTDQLYCPFNDRVKSCAVAVEKANLKTGHKTIYVPNITGPFDEIFKRLTFAQKWGAKGVMISPGLTGFDIIRSISQNEEIDLPVITHPSLLGPYILNSNSGFSHGLLFAKLQRLSGADAVIYPNFNGRFGFTKKQCREIASSCTDDFYNMKTIFPMPGGGIKKKNIKEMIDLYENDVIYLVGGSLYAEGRDLEKNVKTFLRLLNRI